MNKSPKPKTYQTGFTTSKSLKVGDTILFQDLNGKKREVVVSFVGSSGGVRK